MPSPPRSNRTDDSAASTRRRFLVGLTGLTTSLSLAGCGGRWTGNGAPNQGADRPAPELTGPWPQARADAGNSGFVDAPAPTAEPSVRWTTRSAGTVGAMVATSGNTTESADGSPDTTQGVYVAAEDGRLIAVDPDGEERWRSVVAAALFPPAVGAGRVVVPTRDQLTVIDAATGDVLRSIEISDGVLNSPTLVGDRAFVGTFSGGVVAVDVATGERLWQTGAPSRAYPPLVVDGVAYVTARRWESADGDDEGGDSDGGGEPAGILAALDTDTGDRLWEVALDGHPTAPPGYHDGVTFAGTNRGQVVAVDVASGDPQFRETVGDWVTRGPTAAADGIYVVVLNDGVVKLDQQGVVQWRSEAGGGTNPVLGGDVAIVGTNDGVVAVDRDDGQVRWREETDAGVEFDVAIGGDTGTGGGDDTDGSDSGGSGAPGVVYAGDRIGTITAFDLDTGDRRLRFPFRPRTMPGPIVGPRTVAGGSRDGGAYDLLAADGTEFPLAGNPVESGVSPVCLDSSDLDAVDSGTTSPDAASSEESTQDASEPSGESSTGERDSTSERSETLLGGGAGGSLFRVRTVDYGESPQTPLPPTSTPTATAGPDEPTRTPTPHIDFPEPETVWERRLDVTIRSPITYADGLAYFGTGDGIAAVDPRDGRLRWRFDLEASVPGAPAVRQARVFAVTRDGRVVSVKRDSDTTDLSSGEIDWEESLATTFLSGPAVDDGAVFVADEAGQVTAFGTDGAERFQEDVGGAVSGGPSVTATRVFVGTEGGELLALDRADGSIAWRSSATGPIRGAPAVAGESEGDRTVFVGDHEGTLSAFDTTDGDRRWQADLGQWVDAPPAVGHGAVFVADQTGQVYAVVGDS
ncbi:PQQ-binding-like beta-propeller repeat protein [Halobellus marinus]|uniref:PQQ-binding-like beta-propeller repeat protein n=1 Tax=Halobellus marinus TaxID=3075123 RepID=UPI0028A64768|nr:PQQ-binding-like beta-propeller repeat protein [Halobellus sp. DFY28]